MCKLLRIGFFPPRNRNGWFLDFEPQWLKNEYSYAIYRLIAIFLLIKNTGRSSSQSWKSEDLQGGKLQLPGCLSTNIAKHISNPLKLALNNIAIIFIANLRGLEMCLAFDILGVFVICIKRFKRQQVFSVDVVLYLCSIFDCFIEASCVFFAFRKGTWHFEELLFVTKFLASKLLYSRISKIRRSNSHSVFWSSECYSKHSLVIVSWHISNVLCYR